MWPFLILLGRVSRFGWGIRFNSRTFLWFPYSVAVSFGIQKVYTEETNCDSHWYTHGAKEVIHIRLYPDNVNRNSGIPEFWISTFKKQNSRYRTMRPMREHLHTGILIRRNIGKERNAPSYVKKPNLKPVKVFHGLMKTGDIASWATPRAQSE